MSSSNANNILALKGQRAPGSKSQDFPDAGYVEVDFGPRPVAEETFTVYDDRVRASSRIIAALQYEAPTDKEIDEVTMDKLNIIAGNSRTGSFEVYINAADGSYLEGAFVLGYTIINSDTESVTADDMLVDSDEL